ncbi:MAG: urea transporter [Candidatus Wallbacteria bacterium]|nr:urea transporter [Candidatus Wallbacteria bacterium]
MKVSKIFLPVLKSYAEVYLLDGPFLGFMLLACSLLNPRAGLAGLFCVLSSVLFARLINLSNIFDSSSAYLYNPLLVGMYLGEVFKSGLFSLPLIFLAGILSFLATYALSGILAVRHKLPVLSLPFVVVGGLMCQLGIRYPSLVEQAIQSPQYLTWGSDLPLVIRGFFTALGGLFFSPSPAIGCLIFLLIFIHSRILAFLAVTGYFTGSGMEYLLNGSLNDSFLDFYAFNYILIAMAIGGIFLVPSITSYLLAVFAVLVSIPIYESARLFYLASGFPVFTLPFNATVLIFLYTLGYSGFKYLSTLYYSGSPERTLSYYITYGKRFPRHWRVISLPVLGKWTIWQSFDGEWTHQGMLKNSIDLVIRDERGTTFSGLGTALSDFYAYRKPIYAPVRGKVVSIVKDIPDNSPAIVDSERSYGNFVQLYDERGFYVLIAHFASGSILVEPGDWVEVGNLLGFCGNSGYSPQPHVHIQAQLTPDLFSGTASFLFDAFIGNNTVFRDNAIPPERSDIESVIAEKNLSQKVNFILGKSFIYQVNEKGKPSRIEKYTVRMDEAGATYLTDEKNRLYFVLRERIFIFYNYFFKSESSLKFLFLALPKLPLFYRPEVSWQDHLPLELVAGKLTSGICRAISSLNHELFEISGTYTFNAPFSIKGNIAFQGRKIQTQVLLDDRCGFKKVVFMDGRKELEMLLRKPGEEV